MSTSRGRPPRGFCLAGGIIGPTMAHCSSVRSDGYFFRDWFSSTIDAHSSTDGICANYLINLLFCQVIFSDSLSIRWHVVHHSIRWHVECPSRGYFMADDHAEKEDRMALTMTRLEREAFLAGVHVGMIKQSP